MLRLGGQQHRQRGPAEWLAMLLTLLLLLLLLGPSLVLLVLLAGGITQLLRPTASLLNGRG